MITRFRNRETRFFVFSIISHIFQPRPFEDLINNLLDRFLTRAELLSLFLSNLHSRLFYAVYAVITRLRKFVFIHPRKSPKMSRRSGQPGASSSTSSTSSTSATTSPPSVSATPRYEIPPIPIYSGDPEKLLLRTWRDRVDEHFEFAATYNKAIYTPPHMVRLAAAKFVDRAEHWWAVRRHQESPPLTLDELQAELKQYFESETHRLKKLRNKLFVARQISTVAKYNDFFSDVAFQLELPQDHLVFNYIKGLKRDLAIRVDELQPTSLRQAMEIALEKERFCTRYPPSDLPPSLGSFFLLRDRMGGHGRGRFRPGRGRDFSHPERPIGSDRPGNGRPIPAQPLQ